MQKRHPVLAQAEVFAGVRNLPGISVGRLQQLAQGCASDMAWAALAIMRSRP